MSDVLEKMIGVRNKTGFNRAFIFRGDTSILEFLAEHEGSVWGHHREGGVIVWSTHPGPNTTAQDGDVILVDDKGGLVAASLILVSALFDVGVDDE